MSLTLPAFIARWSGATLTERSAAQSHFRDLCAVLGQPAPTDVDQTGAFYTFERGVSKSAGGQGFADVWRRHHFAWEYKGPRKHLAAAYQQLLQYREDLENPPLLVVCDLERFEVHTNFTGTAKRVYAFTLADLASAEPLATTYGLPPLAVLRALFEAPERLRPQQTVQHITEQAAAEFARLADGLRARGQHPEAADRFLMRLLFCLFAEDCGLLPARLFTRLVETTRSRPAEFAARLRLLFGAMAHGGSFGVEDIPHINGGLFAPDADGADGAGVLELTEAELAVLERAARLEWGSVEPAIFGTLFERSLDPAKRAQLGAHYTGIADILLIVEPVLLAPLRARWVAVQAEASAIIARREAAATARGRQQQGQRLAALLTGFAGEIAAVRVLDPACGSGNFLYVALKRLLDLEKEVITFAAQSGLSAFFPRCEPAQLHGLEISPYAHELASVVVWIGYIQWLQDNGFGFPSPPILRPLATIRRMDAVLGEEGAPPPDWPGADVIIGNPPFLGDKKMRAELGDEYVERLRAAYQGRVPGGADLVTYWFERARAQIAAGQAKRAGLLATNSIRGGANRKVLERIKDTGDIFMAWADRPWVLDGAAVRVSMVGFDGGQQQERTLDGQPVTSINANLTDALDLTQARRLVENAGLSFVGGMKKGSFDIPADVAARMLAANGNPNGRPNSDVVVPWVNGLDITRRPRGMWIIDFGVEMPEAEAALYERPFEYVRRTVKPERDQSRNPLERTRWWLHARPAPDLRNAVAPLRRYIGTARVAKHRLFVYLPAGTIPDGQVVVIAREDDYFFGVLHSRAHELCALRLGTSLEDCPRYTPTTTFETFPFPWPPGREPAGDARVEAIAQAARELVEKRGRWLNPDGASKAEPKGRTLTNLYNARPAWLAHAHAALDAAVLAAYGWPADLGDEALLERLLALNGERAGGKSA